MDKGFWDRTWETISPERISLYAASFDTAEDGDYFFIGGKWKGMAFHPYSALEIRKLTDGIGYALLPSKDTGFIVALNAGE